MGPALVGVLGPVNQVEVGAVDHAFVGEPLNKTLFGFAFDKKNGDLRDAVAKATAAVMKNGGYQQALKKFGLERQSLSEPTIDAGQ